MLSKVKMPLTIIGAFLALTAGSTVALAGISAGGQVDARPAVLRQPVEQADHYWHGGYVYGPPAVIYRAPPPPVYVVPAPVYAAPAPVVVAPAPVYVAPPAPVASRVVCHGSNNGAILGGAIGGVTGAMVGANASHHHPWEAATGGSILGVLLGSAIGHAVDAGDQYCTTQAVVAAPIGQPVYWVNPGTGVQYQMVPTRQYVQWNTTCRDYQASALVNGRWQMIRGTTCLQPDGSWQIVSG